MEQRHTPQGRQFQRRRSPQQGVKSEFESTLLDLARVTRVASGGRRFRFRATVVVGDKKGRVGVAAAKGKDVAKAVQKATKLAEKHLVRVSTVEGTIPHEVEAKFGASRVLLRPQRRGRGIVAGGAAREVCEKAGVKDVSAKFLSKTHNKLNNAMATMKALKKLRVVATPAEEKVEEKKEEISVPV